jgi:hypothetical protein
MSRNARRLASLMLLAIFLIPLLALPVRADEPDSFVKSLAKLPEISATTSPANGDQNPYGVAVIPAGFPGDGAVHSGDMIVSNFNDGGNVQGTGTTVVALTPGGPARSFFTAPASLGPVGLTTALVALRSGLVIVGNAPATGAPANSVQNGSLIFLDQQAHVLLNLKESKLLQGPWDMAADDSDSDSPILYVSDVLSGTVTRINSHLDRDGSHPRVHIGSMTQVGSGFMHRTDPNALVVGPTGLLLTPDRESLYVADTGNNRIQVLHDVRDSNADRGAGQTVFSGSPLKGPLALAVTPFGTIVASNGDAAGQASTPINLVVEIDPRQGTAVATRQLDTTGVAGAIFGLTIAQVRGRQALVYVNDNSTTVNVLLAGPDTR